MAISRWRMLASIAGVAVTAAAVSLVAAGSADATTGASVVRHIQKGGTAAYQPRPAGSGDIAALSTDCLLYTSDAADE